MDFENRGARVEDLIVSREFREKTKKKSKKNPVKKIYFLCQIDFFSCWPA
jgi:hypothetical protein